ncbi:hypothetical protein KUTeg_018492 [Tegillarca granosa]|uniref:Uncharacterized protein n=1 Tax=Tegillarca granosa TaxID=220873 RepID=A0ABQ9EHX3_TEGGR|nr:hypothetical protein KUTeg_018492 [Tegillarca granosa]
MMWCCLANSIFLLISIEYGKTELDVIQLKNYTQVFITEISETSLVTSVEPFDFVYYDPSIIYIHSYLYQEHIKQTYLNASKILRDVVKNVYRTVDIMFDWRMRNIYVAQENFVEVTDIDGNFRRTLYWRNITNLQSIAIDPQKGYIFMADAGTLQKLERASMEGDESSRRNIIDKNYIKKPLGLTLDTNNLTVYWSDAFLNVIQKCSYRGDERSTLLQLGVVPGNLALYETTLYWIDNSNHTVNALSLATFETNFVSELPQELLKKKFHITKSGIKVLTTEVHHTFKIRVFELQHLHKVQTEFLLGTEAGVLLCSNGSYTTLFHEHFVLNFALLEDQNEIVFERNYGLVIANLWNMSYTITRPKISFLGLANEIEYDWIGQNVYFLANALIKSVIFVMSKVKDGNYEYRYIVEFLYILTKAMAIDPARGTEAYSFLSIRKRMAKMTLVIADPRQIYYISFDWIKRILFFRTFLEFTKIDLNATNRRTVSVTDLFEGVVDNVRKKYELHQFKIQSGNLYFLKSNGFYIKLNTETLEETVLRKISEQPLSPLWFFIRDLWTDGEKDEECSAIESCWGINNTYECLKPEEICDGLIKCYEGQDEEFCNVCDQRDCRVNIFGRLKEFKLEQSNIKHLPGFMFKNNTLLKEIGFLDNQFLIQLDPRCFKGLASLEIILSLANVKTPREVYAWVIILVLPINAAVNPYLYTLTNVETSKVKKMFCQFEINNINIFIKSKCKIK